MVSLIGKLSSPEPTERRDAAEQLREFRQGAADATPLLITQINAAETRRLPVSHLQALVITLGEIGLRDDTTCATLAGELGTPFVGRFARRALIDIGLRSIPHLIRALNAPRFDAQMNASSALQELGAPVIPALIEALEIGNSTVRCNAAHILGALGKVAIDALPTLERHASSWRPSVRFAAREAMTHIRGS